MYSVALASHVTIFVGCATEAIFLFYIAYISYIIAIIAIKARKGDTIKMQLCAPGLKLWQNLQHTQAMFWP